MNFKTAQNISFSKILFFFISCILICYYFNFDEIIFKRPQSLHLWRQSDCLSITDHYYKGNQFLNNQVYYLGDKNDGKTMSEMPILYYTIGKIWQFTGKNEAIYRFIIFFIFISSNFFFFYTREKIKPDFFYNIISSLFLFGSPIVAYYSLNFLMDLPALSLAIIGISHYYLFKKFNKNSHKYFFFLFFTLAGLLKISSLISFIAIILFEIIFTKDVIKISFKKSWLLILSLISIQIIWYKYAAYYNSIHNSGIFLIGTLPIWNMTSEEINITSKAILEHIKWDYFSLSASYFIVILSLITLFHKQYKNRFLILLTIFGVLSFAALFFWALKDHDYYTINLFIFIPILFSEFQSIKDKINFKLVFNILLIYIFFNQLNITSKRLKSRYDESSWTNQNYVENIKRLENIETFLTKNNIQKNTKVLSLSDNSINTSLYFIQRSGWTNYGIDYDSVKVNNCIKNGAEYLIIYDKKDFLENEKSIRSQIDYLQDSSNGIFVYKLIK